MRAFLGLLPPPNLAQRVAAAASAALGAGPGRVYAAADLHLTLVFLGEIEPARAEALAAGLGGAFAEARPVHLRLGGCGAFGVPGHERALWAGFDLAPEERVALLELVARGRALAAACGVALGGADLARPFAPHLTLTRLRPRQRAPDGFRRLRFDLDWLADEVHLCESARGAGPGTRYPVRATCRLRGL